MPVLSMSSGSVRTSRPSPPGNSRAKVASNAPLHVGVRLGEDLLDPGVDLADDVEQVLAGPLEVLELLGEEAVPLLQRAELLERERVHRAEHRQLALGGAQPLLLLLADERRRLRLGGPSDPSDSAGSGCSPSGSLWSTGTGWSGPYSATRHVAVDAELLERALLELLDPHLLLGAGHLVAVDGVDQLVVLAGQVAQLGANGEQLLLATLAGALDLRAGRGGPADRDVEPVQHEGDRRRRPPGPPRPRGPAAPGARSRGRGSRAPAGRRAAAGRPGRAARATAPRRCAATSRASISPCRAARAASASCSRSSVTSSRSGSSSARASRVSRSPSPSRSLVRASCASAIARSSRSASPRAARAWAPNWPSSSATAARVASDSCSLARATSTRFWASCRSRSSRDMSKPSRSLAAIASDSCWAASSTAAWISMRLGWLAEPPAATCAPSRSPSRVTAVSEASRASSARAAARSSTTATRSSSLASAGRTARGR